MNKDFSGDLHLTEVLAGTADQKQDGLRKFKIAIGGESYFLVSDEPEERVHAVARLVDSQMRAIAQLGHSDDPKRVAVLVALQCASKMLAATELIEKCQAYNDKLLGLITDELTEFYISSEPSN